MFRKPAKQIPFPRPTAAALPRVRSVEAARLLEHQMFFWGKDVLAPQGNLLAAYGCQRFRCADLPHAVHCYEIASPHGRVVLHSTGVWMGGAEESTDGIVYLRPTHRLYHAAPGPLPLPCASLAQVPAHLRSVRAAETLPPTLVRLLRFVRDYETWAAPHLPERARDKAWREHRRTASHGVRWLPPAASRRWLAAALTL